MRNVLAILSVITFLLLVNTAFLNYKVFLSQGGQKGMPETDYNVVNVASPSAQKIVDSCYPDSCVDLIREATASMAKVAPTSKPSTTTSAAKEYYIPIGGGRTMSAVYEDVPGLSVNIDSTKYGKIKSVTFEATMRIPTANGRVYAQLFNSTDKHPVWFSEVSMEGNTPQLVISAPITLDSGNKLYKVQMKSTLAYEAILDSARAHILTE